MRADKLKLQLRVAMDNIDAKIMQDALGNRIAAGLSSEGYNGGYRDALADVWAVLHDTSVGDNRTRLWEMTEKA